jgi:hypothetical protein
MLAAALDAAGRTLHVFPCHGVGADGRCSCGRPDCRHQGKHPRTGHGHREAPTKTAPIRRWWARWPDANLGLACAPSGLVVVDIDPRHGGDVTWDRLVAAHGPALTDTVACRTGGGGHHYYFRVPAGVTLRDGAGRLGQGVDVKANGYVLLPPSRHASGQPYAWLPGASPADRVPAPLPAALRTLLVATSAPHAQAPSLPRTSHSRPERQPAPWSGMHPEIGSAGEGTGDRGQGTGTSGSGCPDCSLSPCSLFPPRGTFFAFFAGGVRRCTPSTRARLPRGCAARGRPPAG